jgi:hypothetical protein
LGKHIKISGINGGYEAQIDEGINFSGLYNARIEKVDGQRPRLVFDLDMVVASILSDDAGLPIDTVHWPPYEERMEKLSLLYAELQSRLTAMESKLKRIL